MHNTEIRVLLIEDDAAVRVGSAQALQLAGFSVEAFADAEHARGRIAPGLPAVVVSDVKLPGADGLQVLRHAVQIDPHLPVILITGHGDISMAVEAMRAGAYDFVEKPFSSERLVDVVARAAEKRALTLEVGVLRQQLHDRRGIEALLLGKSPIIDQVRRKILALANSGADVIVRGETGTGKELVARSLHEFSARRAGRFVAVNCGGLPEPLFESEIFGHETGAFTGATRRRIGKIEWADKGTLFLDEIESMPVALQVKLLRVLQERFIERLGSNEAVPVNCRVIAATKDDLRALAAAGKFRADLFYRLDVAEIELPPLRERREDIPMLFEHFVLRAAERYGRVAPLVASSQRAELIAYGWPGNVRELHNVAERFVLGLLADRFGLTRGAPAPVASLADQIARVERTLIEDSLHRHHGNVSNTAEALCLPKNTLYDRMRRLGISGSGAARESAAAASAPAGASVPPALEH